MPPIFPALKGRATFSRPLPRPIPEADLKGCLTPKIMRVSTFCELRRKPDLVINLLQHEGEFCALMDADKQAEADREIIDELDIDANDLIIRFADQSLAAGLFKHFAVFGLRPGLRFGSECNPDRRAAAVSVAKTAGCLRHPDFYFVPETICIAEMINRAVFSFSFLESIMMSYRYGFVHFSL